MTDLKKSLLILGGGGHARVLIDALKCLQRDIIGITDPNPIMYGRTIMGIPVIGDDKAVMRYPSESIELVNGLGSVGCISRHKRLFVEFKDKGYTFATVIHPFAVIASDAQLSEGTQIMAGVVIQTGSYIGQNTIINTMVSVDHDCRIEDHSHLAPGATLSGDVSVGHGTHIGAGATIIQGISIGSNSLIAAGSVVIGNIGDNKKVKGVPAKED